MNKCVLVMCLLTPFVFVRCANILGFFPTPSISHQIVFQPIWKELSLRGHNVTVYTPCPLKDPSLVNLTEVNLSELFKYSRGGQSKDVFYRNYSPYNKFSQLSEKVVHPSEEAFLENPKVRQMLRDNTSRYDVIFVETPYLSLLAFERKFKCPVIMITSTDAIMVLHALMGNSIHPVLSPDIFMSNVGHLNVFERLSNSFQSLKIILYCVFRLLPTHSEYIKRYFGEDIPPITDLIRNVSALFITVNPAFNAGRPLSPVTVELSYLHIKPKKDLPPDLKIFLDEAREGVIYMSLGSNVKSAQLPTQMINTFIETFSSIPYKVIWKWENESLEGISDNVLLKKWLPQQDLLGHPNIKLFITQAGIQSAEETILNGVPTVALPFFADQTLNAKRMEYVGMGKCMDPFTMDKGQLKTAIIEVIENPRYRIKVQEMSRMSLDRSLTGLEKAVWWTEYVIRNKGTRHLRGSYVEVPIYQYYMLDLFGLLALFIYIPYLVLRMVNGYQKIIFAFLLVLVISYLIYE